MTGFVVVGPEQRLLGLLTARDMLAGEDDQRVDELMTPRERLVTAEPGIELEDARRLLTANRVEKLPLVDGDDRVTGLVTLRDLSLADRYPARDARRAWAGCASRPRSGSAATTSFAPRR